MINSNHRKMQIVGNIYQGLYNPPRKEKYSNLDAHLLDDVIELHYNDITTDLPTQPEQKVIDTPKEESTKPSTVKKSLFVGVGLLTLILIIAGTVYIAKKL